MTKVSAKNQEQQLIQRLMQLPLFQKMSGRHLQLLVKLGESKQVAAGDSLWLEGDAPKAFYILLNGEVEILVSGELVGQIKSLKTLGEVALLGGQPHFEEAVCATHCILLAIPAPVFLHVLQLNSEICQRICRNMVGLLSQQLQKSNDEVGALGESCRAIEEKIAEAERHANDMKMVRRMRGD
ncbi:MAG TPA: cyclic nucleotide-binding domain-containing protein [Candidatus Latescibacteria bacterium]|nr:cyclic nucleotide-binding domain-containing protein [Candidatus Handelsmanbacteria bacterium]HIL10649.1 cyclic nucleotide-binding domain-containing protein [Candidatus Latescibacterota bacterium]